MNNDTNTDFAHMLDSLKYQPIEATKGCKCETCNAINRQQSALQMANAINTFPMREVAK